MLERAQRGGALVSKANSGHWRVVNPNTGSSVQIPATPKSERSIITARVRLRRIGVLT